MGWRMPIGGWLMVASVVVAWAGHWYYWWNSLLHLSEGGEQRQPAALTRGGRPRTREDFTATGWKYRQRSWRILALPLIVFVIVTLFQKWLL